MVRHASLAVPRPRDPRQLLAHLTRALAEAFPDERVLRWAVHRVEDELLHLEVTVWAP